MKKILIDYKDIKDFEGECDPLLLTEGFIFNDCCLIVQNHPGVKSTYNGITRSIRGTVIGGSPRLLSIDDYSTEITLSDKMIVLRYKDVPGVIGAVGNAIGEAGINIAHMAVGRAKGKATMFLTIDKDVPENVLNAIASKVTDVEEIKYIKIEQ